jgi:hypothetical protein
VIRRIQTNAQVAKLVLCIHANDSEIMRAAVLFSLAAILVTACDTALTPTIAGLGPSTGGGDSCAVTAVIVTPSLDTMHVGQNFQPAAQVQSCTASANEGVLWLSSDSTIASVDATSGFILALRTGRATITASAVADSTKKGSMAIVVSP